MNEYIFILHVNAILRGTISYEFKKAHYIYRRSMPSQKGQEELTVTEALCCPLRSTLRPLQACYQPHLTNEDSK